MTKFIRLLPFLALSLISHQALAQTYGSAQGQITSPSQMSLNGVFTFAGLPSAVTYLGYTAYTSDQGQVYSNGTAWIPVAPVTRPLIVQNWGTPFGMPPSGVFPDLGANQPATYVIGQAPSSSATLSVSATTGSVTATFSAATLLGTAADVGRVITINDTTFKYCTITAQSSTTVATCTVSGGTLSGTGPFANSVLYLSGTPTTNTTAFSVPLPVAFPGVWLFFSTGGICSTCINGGANPGGLWYATCVTTTVCTVYNQRLNGTTTPTILTNPTPLLTQGIGTYAQTTSGTVIFTLAVPANSMGPNGSLVVTTFGERPSNVDTVNMQGRWNNLTLGQVQSASVIWYPFIRTIRNAGVTNSQVEFAQGAGSTNDFSAANNAVTYLSIDTTVVQNFTIVITDATATDWYFNLGGSIQANYAP